MPQQGNEEPLSQALKRATEPHPGASILSAASPPSPPHPSPSSQYASARRLRWEHLLVTAGLVLILLYCADRALSMLRASSLIYGLATSHGPILVRAYAAAFAHVVDVSEHTIPAGKGSLDVRLLTPHDRPNAPMIVLIHGFAAQGNQDPLLNRLAERLCRTGLRVAMPSIPSAEMKQMGVSALTDIGDSVHWAAVTSGQQVSLLGVSFSGGLVVASASLPRYAPDIKMVFSISGYDSIDRLGRYYLHDAVRSPNGELYTDTPPPGALAAMALQYLDEMVPAHDVDALTRPLTLMLTGIPPSVIESAPELTPAQQNLLRDLVEVQSPAMRERYYALLRHHQAELAAISPAGNMIGLQARLFILHGLNDRTIPRGEAEWTQAEAPSSTHASLLVTPWMHHAVLDPDTPLAHKIRVAWFVSHVLDIAFDPSLLAPSLLAPAASHPAP